MASRSRKRPAAGSVAAPAPGGAHEARPARYPHLEAVIAAGGQIMIGTVRPIRNAAVAHDGKKTLAMLRKRPHEPLAELLLRLDAAIASAHATGQRVDEINTPASNTRYEL